MIYEHIPVRIRVYKDKGDVDVLIVKHKLEDKWSFVNLTKGHICPCKFDSFKEACADLENYKAKGKIKDWKFIDKGDCCCEDI